MTTATGRSESDLRALIERAIAADDQARLKALQEEYRSSGFAVIRLSPEPPRLISRPAWSRSTPARSTPPLDDSRRAPILGPVPGSLPVVVSVTAQEGIRSTSFDDGLELSGGLYGRLADGELRVENVTTMRDVLRTPSQTEINREQLDMWAYHFAAAGWRLVGDWHCHPGFSDDPVTPSALDRTAWKRNAEHYGIAWLGLILSPHRQTERDGDVWGFLPRISGWLTEPHAAACSPARLVIEKETT